MPPHTQCTTSIDRPGTRVGAEHWQAGGAAIMPCASAGRTCMNTAPPARPRPDTTRRRRARRRGRSWEPWELLHPGADCAPVHATPTVPPERPHAPMPAPQCAHDRAADHPAHERRPRPRNCSDLRPARPARRLPGQPLPGLRRAARTRSGAAHARRLALSHAPRRPDGGVPRRGAVQLRQARRVRAQVRGGVAAVRAPHHQPGIQRPAAAHPGAQAHHGRAHPPRHRRHGTRPDRPGGPPARPHRGAWRRRPDRGLCRGHPGRDHRQPAGRAARRPWPAARLVAGHPGCARTRAHARAARGGQPQRDRDAGLPAHARGRTAPGPRRP